VAQNDIKHRLRQRVIGHSHDLEREQAGEFEQAFASSDIGRPDAYRSYPAAAS
jgi:hypothetical protein